MRHLLPRLAITTVIAGTLFSMTVPATVAAPSNTTTLVNITAATQSASPTGWRAPRPGRCYPSNSFEARRIRTGKNWGSFEIGGVAYICETCINAGNTWACTYDRKSAV